MAKAIQMLRPSLRFLKIKETSRATAFSYSHLADLLEDERIPAWVVADIALKNDGLEVELQDVIDQRDRINRTFCPSPFVDFSRPSGYDVADISEQPFVCSPIAENEAHVVAVKTKQPGRPALGTVETRSQFDDKWLKQRRLVGPGTEQDKSLFYLKRHMKCWIANYKRFSKEGSVKTRKEFPAKIGYQNDATLWKKRITKRFDGCTNGDAQEQR